MNINQLIEKYWNAEASLQEEAELRAYFSSDDVASEHEQYNDLFTFFSISRLQTTELDVEEIFSKISSIDLILEKYWNAETSLEEEAQLKDYFSSDAVAPDHEQYKDLFNFYQISSAQTTDLDLNQLFHQRTDIDLILEKYWNAETSLEEEKTLKDYFTGNEIAEDHLAYSGMFDIFASKSLETTDLDVKEILMKAKNEVGHRAVGSSIIQLEAKTKVFSLQKWAVGLAAIFVLGFAAVTLMNETSETQYKGRATVLDEEAEAQEAYEITKEALAFLSKNMNKGSQTVINSVSKVEKASIFK